MFREVDDPPRVLIYSQDSFGLGHLRRATNLANEITAQRSDATVLLVVDSPVAPFFKLSPNIDFLKLPTVVKVGAGVFRAGLLNLRYDHVKTLRSKLLRDVVEGFSPHVMLVDHMPGGANRELLAALETIRRKHLHTRVVLGLRDIIDDPSVTREVWHREGVYRILERSYQDVLIYGSQTVFDTADEYRIHEAMGDRVHYCGYVCNMNEVQEPHLVREQRGIHEERVVTVMAGGGADSARLMQASLEAIHLLSSRHSLATLMVTGPFFPLSEWRALASRAEELGVRLERTVGDSLECISAADVVVGMAGYNTLSEILRFGKRAVIVPRAGPSAEQTMRSRLFAERGLIDIVEQSRLTPQALADALENALNGAAQEPARIPVELDGVANATRTLLAALPAAEASPAGPSLAPTQTARSQNGTAEQGAAASADLSIPEPPSITTNG